MTFAYLFGGLHVLWSALVLTGFAQSLANFVAWAHMMNDAPEIGAFNATAALTLIIMTSLVGYGIGFVAATVWQKVRS